MNTGEAQQKFQQAGQLYRDGKFADALAVLDGLSAAFPNNAEVVYARALSLAELSRLIEAANLCDTLTRLGDPRGEVLKGKIALRQPASTSQRGSAGLVGTRRTKTFAAAAVAALVIVAGGIYYVTSRESKPSSAPTREPAPASVPPQKSPAPPSSPQPAQPPGAGQNQGEYMLEFPADHSIGYVFLSDKDKQNVQRLDAQGSISVPRDANVILDITGPLDGIDWTKLKRLPTLDFSQSKGVSADTVNWAALESLKELNLSNSSFQAATLGQLASLPNLEELHIGGQGLINDERLVQIGKLVQLKRLQLGYIWEKSPNITASGIAQLANLRNLESLDLAGFDLTADRAEPLAGLSTLKSLMIHCSFADDTTFKHFATMKSVQELGMGGIEVKPNMLEPLASLPSLRSLKLGDAYGQEYALGDAVMADIGKIVSLEELTIVGNGVADAGLAHLKNLTRLKTLALGGHAITDAGLVHLESLRSLKQLDLIESKISNTGLTRLKKALPQCAIKTESN
ncbi:MAG: hypothetical protein NTZ09_16725 [Candidatus Hydrogenedentes bacterium]|nr:hypothetical protein [Candidatus Hydrogenedentota bacterium]